MDFEGQHFSKFRAISSVILGGAIGVLIGVPLTQMAIPPLSYVIMPTTLIFGALSGYRRRKSTAFFYFTLVCVCVLSVVLMLAEVMPNASQP